MNTLPAGMGRVVVAYADHHRINAPHPREILTRASELGCHGVLLDTFDKEGGCLGTWFSVAELTHWVRGVRALGLLTVIAGSLDAPSLRKLAPLEPDYLGVRGAACTGGRSGTVDANLVRDLILALQPDIVRHAASASGAPRDRKTAAADVNSRRTQGALHDS
jgi:uncharacterized protein (UPF0264 family)